MKKILLIVLALAAIMFIIHVSINGLPVLDSLNPHG